MSQHEEPIPDGVYEHGDYRPFTASERLAGLIPTRLRLALKVLAGHGVLYRVHLPYGFEIVPDLPPYKAECAIVDGWHVDPYPGPYPDGSQRVPSGSGSPSPESAR